MSRGQQRSVATLLLVTVTVLVAWLSTQRSQEPAAHRDPPSPHTLPLPPKNATHAVPRPSPEETPSRAKRTVVDAPVTEVDKPTERAALDVWGKVSPEDLFKTGLGSIHCTFLDRETRSPASGTVELWRIDAPASDNWSRGDQRQQRGRLDNGKISFEGLASGKYRVVPFGVRPPGGTPQILTVDDKSQDHQVSVETPKSKQIFVRAFLVDGTPLTRFSFAETTRLGGGGYEHATPRWRVPRVQSSKAPVGLKSGAGGSSSPQRLRQLIAGPHGLALGTMQEASLSNSARRRIRLRTDGRITGIPAVAAGQIQEDTACRTPVVAVLVDPSRVYRKITTLDGRPVGIASSVRITGGVFTSTSQTPWREAQLKVTIEHPGYRSVTADWNPSEEFPGTTLLKK